MHAGMFIHTSVGWQTRQLRVRWHTWYSACVSIHGLSSTQERVQMPELAAPTRRCSHTAMCTSPAYNLSGPSAYNLSGLVRPLHTTCQDLSGPCIRLVRTCQAPAYDLSGHVRSSCIQLVRTCQAPAYNLAGLVRPLHTTCQDLSGPHASTTNPTTPLTSTTTAHTTETATRPISHSQNWTLTQHTPVHMLIPTRSPQDLPDAAP
jgi:hypothetical protein